MQYHPPHLALSTKPLSLPKTRLSTSSYKPHRISASAAATSTARPTTTMYELLSVTEHAGRDEIKAAYRRLARRCHPDTCRSESRKEELTRQFIEAREAYRVLSDPVLREDYDCRLRYGVCHNGVSSLRKRAGFGDWESQLEGLRYRMYRRPTSASSWGSRMRART